MKPKYLFRLRNISPAQILEKYGITIFNAVNKTNIKELEVKTIENISFVDENKTLVRGIIAGILSSTKNKQVCCYWDRFPIPEGVYAIGCPIRYVCDKAVKHHYSEASKMTYTIRENVPSTKKHLNNSSTSVDIEQNDYYETFGAFCSFNCCKAFILENKNNPRFEFSEMFLSRIYSVVRGEEEDNDVATSSSSPILPAPSWILLQEYGGTLTIDKFRESFNRVEYKDVGSFMTVPVGRIFTENIKM